MYSNNTIYTIVQLNNYSEAKLNTLDPTTRKALYQHAIQEESNNKQKENEKNEQFVLNFTFQSIDSDKVGFISKDEALSYL